MISLHGTAPCNNIIIRSIDLQYRALVPMFYRGAAAAIIVYEITSEASFNSTKNWVEELKRKEPNCTVIVIAGNKCDLEKQREVSD